MEDIAIGVVGVGSLGYHHARLLRDISGARLVGIYDRDDERASEVAGELTVDAYPDLDGLLADADAVTVVVPTSAHFDVAKAALESGCDIFIEKPITTSLEEADALIRLGSARDRIIQVGHVERFNGAVRACEPYLENPLFVEGHRLASFARRGTDVPVVLDLMIHDIDLVVSLVGQAVADVRAVGVPVLSGSVDIANARIEFAGGAVANITASRVSVQRQRKIRFFQPSGYMSLDLARGRGEFYRRKQGSGDLDGAVQLTDFVEHIHLEGDDREPLRLELESFLRTVRGEAPVAATAAEGRLALQVALEIVESIEKHQHHVLDPHQTGA